MNSEALTDLVIDALDDVKAKDIVRIDVRDLTTVTDFMVVASGTSNRHVKALVDNVTRNRNIVREHFLTGDWGWLYFLDSDCVGQTCAGFRAWY